MDRKVVFAARLAAIIAAVLAAVPVMAQQVTGVPGSPSATRARAADWKPDRTVLPIQTPKLPTYTQLDVRSVKQKPPHYEIKAPAGAPNVLIVLIDDMGFGVSSTFGGPVPIPTMDRLGQAGLRFNNFRTTALCSPTRAALKSGRNHHVNNMGSITETATGFPGQTGQIPNSVAPMPEMLRLNGYSTGAFGKWHELATWETSVSGPYQRWPTVGGGFDKFYGFLGGETNQWAPLLYDGVTRVDLPNDPNYHFLTDMTNQAIAWVKFQKAMTPDRPLFVYFAPGATHAPHHVPKEWIAKWKGKFEQGWDKLREETLARQIGLGVVPPGTKLARKPEAIKDWDKLSNDEKRLFVPQAEVYAAYAEMTDYEIGRLVRAIEDLGDLDNTLIFYIAGDNGASAEGTMNGMFNEMTYFNGVQEQVRDLLKVMDQWGSPETYPHMAAGWAVAFDSPFQWTKQVASSFGGTRNGMAGMQENVFINVKNKSLSITAAVEIPQGGANGAILVQGGRFGGWALYMTGGKPAYAYNWLGLQRYTVAAPEVLPPGKATIKFDFKYDGGGMGKGGTGMLSVNGQEVAEGRIERTQAAIFSADETADVGIDLGTPVVEAVGAEAKSRFTGRIPKVTVEIRDVNPRAEAAVKSAWAEVRYKTE
jgi:arylsulfatase A-like enzyme